MVETTGDKHENEDGVGSEMGHVGSGLYEESVPEGNMGRGWSYTHINSQLMPTCARV